MSVQIPESHKDLIERPICGTLATTMPDGQPHTSLIWYDYDGTHISIATVEGRQKVENIRYEPRVSLLISEPDNPYRYMEIRGVVEEISTEGTKAHLRKITQAYLGTPEFYGTVAPKEQEAQDVRLIFKIKPIKIFTFGQAAEKKDEAPDLDNYNKITPK